MNSLIKYYGSLPLAGDIPPLSGLRTRGFELIKVFIKKRELRYLTLKMSRVKKRNYKIPSHS